MTQENAKNTDKAFMKNVLSFIPSEEDIQRYRNYTTSSEIPSEDWLKIINRSIALDGGFTNIPGGTDRISLDNGSGPVIRTMTFLQVGDTCKEAIATTFDPNVSALFIATSYLASKADNPDFLEGFEMIFNDVQDGNKFGVLINRKNTEDPPHECYDDYDFFVLDPEQDRWVDLKKEFGHLMGLTTNN